MTSTAQALLARLDLVIDRSPDSPSVVIDGLVAHTYRSLDRRARALADEWTQRGLQSGDLVALVLGHHADHIAGMLAAWRCNAAFLPLDPALPKARTESILTHSQAAWALDTSGTRRLNDAPRRYLNAHGKAAAYVVYTSGSTGTPKGVIVGHDGLLDMLASQIDAFALDADSRAVWLLSASFDASISDIGTALLSGAQLHTSQHDLLRNPSELVSFVDAQQITHADLPPALLRVLSPTSFADSLRTLIVGGEPSPPEVIRQWASRRRIINVYGPTEATVCTSLCECDATTWQRPILGHPTRGVTYEVVDPDGKDIAEQPGELIISGPCVAWGYVDESTRSSSHFFERNGTRSYRTGDRVIAHANGELEFVGRVDRQLKLHGLRIEPAEIENAMSALDGVTSAIALLVRARDDDSELVVAYEGAQRDSRQLRQELSKVLPRWMQPSRLIWMEALPRSVSGKIDIRRVETLVGRRQSVSCDSFFEMLRSLVSHADLTREHALNELAIDSFSALRLLAWAHSNNLPLRIDDLSSHRSIRDIEKMLSERTGQDRIASTRRTCEELRARVMSDAGFCRLETTRPQAALDSKREVVFLTGAAGFLGAHTLAELLEDPALHIRALVRAHDRSHARAKIAARLRRHGRVLSEEQWSRVDLWCGDLAEPRFGLGERWFDCATNVRCIAHLAARVSLTASLDELWRDNVIATREVLSFAIENQLELVHASTLSVLVSSDLAREVMSEQNALEGMTCVDGAYAQSKWAAEWMLRRVEASLPSLTHVRLGLLTGDLRTGLAADHDQLSMFLRGLASLGAIPKQARTDRAVDLTPVDQAARMLAALIRQARTNQTFHIANARHATLGDIIETMKLKGVRLREVDSIEWQELVSSPHAELSASATLDRAVAVLSLEEAMKESDESDRGLDLFLSSGAEFDTSATMAAVGFHASRISPPNELLERYLDVVLEGLR